MAYQCACMQAGRQASRQAGRQVTNAASACRLLGCAICMHCIVLACCSWVSPANEQAAQLLLITHTPAEKCTLGMPPTPHHLAPPRAQAPASPSRPRTCEHHPPVRLRHLAPVLLILLGSRATRLDLAASSLTCLRLPKAALRRPSALTTSNCGHALVHLDGPVHLNILLSK